MARINKLKSRSISRVSIRSATGRGAGKNVVIPFAKVFYKPAESGVNENDLLHIVVAKPATSQTIANSIRTRFVGSSKRKLALEGIVVADVQIGDLKPSLLKSGTRGVLSGRVVALEIDRNPEFSTMDVVKRIQTRLMPGVRLAGVKVVNSMEDLPGDPTGPGPK